MNRIFNLIWNTTIAGWVVASEHSRRQGKPGSGRRGALALLASAALSGGVAAADLPSGGIIKQGTGSISQPNGQQMNIQQNTPKLAIEWQSFDVGANNKVNFQQPNSSAIALNRVVGTNGSQILGQLTSNGRVFLVNPNGILFGSNAQVNVGGLVASTLDMSLVDFASSRYRLQGGSAPASVTNQGTIVADGGSVALLGGKVSNEGYIQANLGSVTLAAGQAITVDFVGDGLLNVQLNGAASNALAYNDGYIKADGGQVLLAAQHSNALLNMVVNNQGAIEALSLEDRAGRIILNGSSQGTVQADGWMSSTGIDNSDAGNITVQGQNINLNAQLDNGSYGTGRGGNVQISADKLLQFNGQIDVSSVNGQGGNVLTRGQQLSLGANSYVDSRGSNGQTGNWQLAANQLAVGSGSGQLGAATIVNSLRTSNIELRSLQGDLVVNSDVNWNTASQLTLSAQNNVLLNANLKATGQNAGIAFNHGTGSDYQLTQGKTVTLSGQGARFAVNGDAYTVIQNANQLQAMENNLSGRYVLGNTIDASATAQWNGGLGFRPVGSVAWQYDPVQNTYVQIDNTFKGTLSGLGNTINQLTIKQNNAGYSGLFGRSSGNIRNLGLVGGTVVTNTKDSGGYAGSLVGWQEGGQIHDVYAQNFNIINNTISSDGWSYDSTMGGLIGWANNLTLHNAYATGNLTVQNGIYSTAGGLIGRVADSTIDNVYATGSITAYGILGGLFGIMYNSSLNDAYATGNVTATRTPDNYGGSSLGGLIGYIGGDTSTLDGFSVIHNVYATGDVTVDPNSKGSAGNSGGLIGFAYKLDLSNAYAKGRVTGEAGAGGLIGQVLAANIHDVYATGSVEGAIGYAGGLIGYASGRLNQFNNTTTIHDAYATGNVTARGWTGGGLIGTGDNLSIDRVYATGAVQALNSGTSNNGLGVVAGGLIGSLSYSSLTNAHATGEVNATLYNSLSGGLIGRLGYDSTVSDVYASGKVTAVGAAGGLIGKIEGSNVNILRTQASGNVSAQSYAGGLVGDIYTASVDNLQSSVNIADSYASGSVTSSGYAGGLVGEAYTLDNYASASSLINISNSHASGNVNSTRTAGGLIGYARVAFESFASININGSTAKGAVTSDNVAAGLVGEYSSFNGQLKISNTNAYGNITGKTVDPMIGTFDNFGGRGSAKIILTNSYNSGTLNGNKCTSLYCK
ncbi:filamentous hemagglutinin N-terminal domain-containing protein [Neisseriaceae bacterium TC5R-5]|nr:filamentous hemagglutinin N-terminal domain-containing protein [Neisseriaceae bacterium TC5R-5]